MATQVETLQRTGIRRLGTARSGFRWVRADGSRPSAGELDRLDALKLPPAWTDVVASPSPAAALQAVGRDAAGRWQYRYHPAAVKRRDERKYRRLVHFAEALPTLRRTVARHLAQPGLGREKVLAAIVRILSTCFLRPGSQAYAAENGSYGIATLRNDHVHVVGDRVRFDFPGKSGKRQVRELCDRRLARIVRELKAAGRARDEVFKFRNGAGELVDVRRRHVNDYIKEVMGERFSAKDFRTWAGTLVAASALARRGADTAGGKAARKRSVTAAVREAADLLGNTPAICRVSYVAPQILERYERGDVVERHVETAAEIVGQRGSGLHPAEQALLDMLRRCHRNDPAAAGGRRAATAARRTARSSGARPALDAPRRRRASPTRGESAVRRRGAPAMRASARERSPRRGANPRRRATPARAAAANGDAAGRRGARDGRRAGASPASVFSPRVRVTA